MRRGRTSSFSTLGGYVLGTRAVQRLDRVTGRYWPVGPADHNAARSVGRGTPRHVIDRRRAARRARRRTRQGQRRG